MVAGKVKVAMGFQKSPSPAHVQTPPPQKKKQQPPPSPSTTTSSTKSSSHKSSFSRIGIYFPRSSAQVQPRPPDGTELLRLVEELRESESRLKTELLEHKLLKESIAIVPVLENELTARETEIQRSRMRAEEAEAENERLTKELEEMKLKMEEEKRESERKLKALEDEIVVLKKTASYCSSNRTEEHEQEHFSTSLKFQGIGEVSVKSNLMKNLRKTMSDHAIVNPKHNEGVDLKREFAEIERPRHSRCNSEELADCTDSVLNVNIRSRLPRVPNPPPKPSSSSPSSPSSGSLSKNSNGETEQVISQPLQPAKAAPPPPPPPPRKLASKAAPPPPPPPPKGGRMASAKVRRVPEVVEFYHSLMRRDSQSRRESSSGASAEVPATANARDMIGEIENRSTHLLAVSTREFCCVITILPLVIYVSV